MVTKIKCTHRLEVNETSDNVVIKHDETTVEIHKWNRIREMICQTYAVAGRYRDNGKETLSCFIEIIGEKGDNYTFEYPYKMRFDMLKDFEMIRRLLDPLLKEVVY